MTNEEWFKNLCEKLAIPLVEKSYHGFVTTWELPEYYIRTLENYVDWSWISSHNNLSIEFLREFRDKIDWGMYFDREEINPKIKKEFYKEWEESLIDF